MSRRRVLFLFPTAWDARQLEACRSQWDDRFEVVYDDLADADCPSDLDAEAFLDRVAARWGGSVAGVTSSSDYPGATLAAALAERLGLPGSPPAAVLRCSHKYYSRMAQAASVPDATPAFELVRGDREAPVSPATGYPCFVKPVKGAFSIMSGKIPTRTDLEAFLTRPETRAFLEDYLGLFNRLVRRYTDFEVDGSAFLLESFLHGQQVTVEGWVRQGRSGLLGVVDSVMHPEVPSFARFDYPSALRPEVAARAWDIARTTALEVGLDHTLFNVELIYEPNEDRLHVIEVNPRLCGQFGDLYAKVDGVSGYVAALELAAGHEPVRATGGGPWRQASSVPLRTFRPVRVDRAPTDADVRAAEALGPDALVWTECAEGQELADFAWEDGRSVRYAVLNVGGDDRWDLRVRIDAVRERLGYRMTPLEG